MKHILNTLSLGKHLTYLEAYNTLLHIAKGEAEVAVIGALLLGIQQKGVEKEEFRGFRDAMLEVSKRVDLSAYDTIDIVGTGGDGKDTFNISTTTAFVVAGAGQKVAKHGNHGVSSTVGSSAVLEALGLRFCSDAGQLENQLETCGICFLHAPLFHPAMKHVAPIRKSLGIKTFFNILGPLLNPSGVKYQLSGVSDLNTFALYEYLLPQQTMRFGVVYALDGYDEISLTGNVKISSSTFTGEFSAKQLGFNQIQPEALKGGKTAEESAKILIQILENKASSSQKDAVLANASLALSISKNVSFSEATEMAEASIESGSAWNVLKTLTQIKKC